MRGWFVISVLAVAGCGGEHLGFNPNYQFGSSSYGEYRLAREAALTGNSESPAVVPVARPFDAPTAQQIAGRDPVPVPATRGLGRAKAAAAAAPVAAGTATPLVANDGPYAGSVPVLAAFAAETTHQPGTALYPRSGGSASQAARVCASYPNPEAAQIGFLAAGGPQVDTRGMDPDGDGFVCGWDPRPLRQPAL